MTGEKQIEIYKGGKGEVVFNVDAEHETIWADIEQIAELFDVSRRNIEVHLKNIYLENELDKNRTAKKTFVVRTEGSRQVRREVSFYNLDAIISVGYRVNSKKATNFRIWATKTLHQYIIDGVAINELKNSLNGGDLFGKKRNDSFDGALESIYQSYDGKELYIK